MDNRKEKFISADLLCDLAKVVLKSNVFKSSKDTLSKKERQQLEGNLYLYIIIILSQNWKKQFLEKQNFNFIYCGGIFFFWEHGKEKQRSFINDTDKIHPNIKFTAEWSKASMHFLDATVSIARV